MPWQVTVRASARVRKQRFEQLESALAELETEGRALATAASAQPMAAGGRMIRRFEPVQIVAGRIELSGPQRLLPDVHAGVDIRGDGSSEAFIGRVRKRVVEPREGEDAYAALRRELTARGSRR